jgi:hypothetical protein
MKKMRTSLIVLLSLMVFITSSGLTVNLHYCAGKLANVSLKEKHANCMMSAKKANCHPSTSKSAVAKKDTCCKNQQVKAKTDDKLTEAKSKVKSDNYHSFNFVQNYFTSLFSFNSEVKEKEEPEFKSYSIFPLFREGLYILLQNFRD